MIWPESRGLQHSTHAVFDTLMTIHETLTSTHMEQHVSMAEWLLANPSILDRLWSSDEAHFYLFKLTCSNIISYQI